MCSFGSGVGTGFHSTEASENLPATTGFSSLGRGSIEACGSPGCWRSAYCGIGRSEEFFVAAHNRWATRQAVILRSSKGPSRRLASGFSAPPTRRWYLRSSAFQALSAAERRSDRWPSRHDRCLYTRAPTGSASCGPISAAGKFSTRRSKSAARWSADKHQTTETDQSPAVPHGSLLFHQLRAGTWMAPDRQALLFHFCQANVRYVTTLPKATKPGANGG